MPEGNPHLRNLATRKQLLIVKGEFNRRLLIEEGNALAQGPHGSGGRAAYGRGDITAALNVFSAFRSKTGAPSTGKRSRFEPFLDTLRLGALLWTTPRNGKGRR
jgi:hypothetical protein